MIIIDILDPLSKNKNPIVNIATSNAVSKSYAEDIACPTSEAVSELCA